MNSDYPITPRIAIPFSFHQGVQTYVNVVEQDSVEDVAMCVEGVVRCNIGHREDKPEFGIPDPTFGQLPLKWDEIQGIVHEWEPRALTAFVEDPTFDQRVEQVLLEVSIEGGSNA